MTNAVIAATGLFTPDQSISNAELVDAYNAWAERWNADNADAIAAGELEARTPSSPATARTAASRPVLSSRLSEFDAAGRYLQGWGGPGAGYEWPADEHAIHVDHKRNVWITSAGGPRLRDRTDVGTQIADQNNLID